MNSEAIEEEEMPILPGQKELHCANVVGPKGQIYRYLGGVTQPCLPDGWKMGGDDISSDSDTGSAQPEYADFTDSEEEEEDVESS
jgi:hypothetical protein